MANKKPIIMVMGGYARSGKSTLLEVIREQVEYPDIAVVSTSETLDEHAWHVYLAICSSSGRQNDFTKSEFISLLRTKSDGILGFNSRKFKTDVAESIVVPAFGRANGIVRPTFKNMLSYYNRGFNVIIECIGGEEWGILEGYLRDCNARYTYFNVRRPGHELSGADIRQLLPTDLELVNDAPDIDSWKEKCKDFILGLLGGASTAQGDSNG